MSAIQPAQCPICDRGMTERSQRKLYEVHVCKKCSHAFANRRQFAWIADFFFWSLLFTLIEWALEMMFAQLYDPYAEETIIEIAFWLIYGWIVTPLIFVCKDGFHGYSPGKWLCGVRVVDWETREPIGFLQSIKRNLCQMIPFVILVIAFQLIRGRRMGDFWAKTGVIWVKKAHRIPFEPRGILCTNCGYDLTGNVSGRCPECGKDIPMRPVSATPSTGRSGQAVPGR